MKIREVMTKNVETIHPDATLVEAAEKMRALNVGPLPVFEGNSPVGMLTDRDIVVRAVALGRDVRSAPVREVMSPDVEWCFDTDSVKDAAKKMRDLQIRRLLVLDKNRQPVGIVALGDLAVDADEELAGKALEGISEPAAPTTH